MLKILFSTVMPSSRCTARLSSFLVHFTLVLGLVVEAMFCAQLCSQWFEKIGISSFLLQQCCGSICLAFHKLGPISAALLETQLRSCAHDGCSLEHFILSCETTTASETWYK